MPQYDDPRPTLKDATVAIEYDPDPRIPDEGARYLNCNMCMQELPDGESMETYSKQQMAIRKDGYFQLRCTRHNVNITVIYMRPVVRNAKPSQLPACQGKAHKGR